MNSTTAADLLVTTLGSASGVEGFAEAIDDSRTIANAIARWAAAGRESPAFVGAGKQRITYSDLLSLISRFAGELANAGFSADHRVGLLVPPGMPGGQLAVALACNATLVPINPALKPQEIVESGTASGLHAIVIPSWLETEARSAMLQQEIAVFDAVRASDGKLGLELVTPSVRAAVPVRKVTESDVALLLRSSGTTGAPKLIPVTHGNMVAMAEYMGSGLWYGLTARDRAACRPPLHYGAGLKTSLFVPLMLGASVAFPPPEQMFDLAEWLDELQPTYLSVAPGVLQRMIERMKVAPREFHGSSLRFVMCSGSYLPEETRAAAESMLRVPILEYYGSAEAGIMAANPVPPGKAKPGTVGLPWPGELVVVDENRQPVANGTAGEVMVRGPGVTPGYLAAAGSSIPEELEDGWLPTGDIGRLDDEGYLCLVGREKEVINRGGEKVFPYEVEKAILQHPAVLEAAAFGVPHPRLGESVAAAVVLKPGSTVPEDELKDFLAARLASFKLPRRLCYMRALPRGSTGKLLRSSLRQSYETLPRDAVPPGRDYLLQLELCDLWKRLLGRPDIGLDDDFFDIGGDSLLAADMLIEVEALVGKPYPQSELSTLTIRRMAEVFASDMPAEREVMTQVKAGAGIPLFFCHGDFVERGFYAQKLAALIPGDHPIFLLHCYPEPLGSSVDEIARVYLQHILSAVPRSPVFIAGYCNSGMMAWHLAYLLRREGVEVVELLLIETMSLNARPAVRALPAIFDAAGALIPGRAGRFLQQQGMRHCWRWIRRFGAFSFRALRKKIIEWRELPAPRRDVFANADRTYYELMSRYVPPPIDACVTCFIADQGRHFETNPTFWRRLAPSVSKVTTPGTHNGLLVTGRQALATGITEVLDRATRRYLLGSARPARRDQEVVLG